MLDWHIHSFFPTQCLNRSLINFTQQTVFQWTEGHWHSNNDFSGGENHHSTIHEKIMVHSKSLSKICLDQGNTKCREISSKYHSKWNFFEKPEKPGISLKLMLVILLFHNSVLYPMRLKNPMTVLIVNDWFWQQVIPQLVCLLPALWQAKKTKNPTSKKPTKFEK